MVIFGGHVTGKGTNALHELHINVTYDLSKKGKGSPYSITERRVPAVGSH